jgi:glycosyltransferase involved in cell wall biosynthesis
MAVSAELKGMLSIIVPALNEEKNIKMAVTNCLRALDGLNIKGEVVVINDGSTDNTEQIIRQVMTNDQRIGLIHHDTPHGIGGSFWEGVDMAKGEFAIMLPGDNENDPWEILQYYKLMPHVDMVIPFVFNKEARSLFRNALSFLYRFIINTSFLVYFNYTNGTIIYRRSILKELKVRSSSFFFQTDILVRLVKKGYLFAEVPYRLGLRKTDVSKAVSFPSLMQVIKGYCRLMYDYYWRERRHIETYDTDSVTYERRNNVENEQYIHQSE